MTPYEKLKIARMQGRPTGISYINNITDDFIELHGDRCFMDDMSIVGGIAAIGGVPVTIIVQEKGTDIKSRIEHNFGSPKPEGYRKALRLMKQAEKFRRPIITLIDTVGADCGIESEERGQGFVIANIIMKMMSLKTPCISVIIGEGESGGALGIACSDVVYMAENAIYSVLSPEGFAGILWKDKNRAEEACDIMKITANDLLELKVIDGIIPENKGGVLATDKGYFESVKRLLQSEISRLSAMDSDELLQKRHERFRSIGADLH